MEHPESGGNGMVPDPHARLAQVIAEQIMALEAARDRARALRARTATELADERIEVERCVRSSDGTPSLVERITAIDRQTLMLEGKEDAEFTEEDRALLARLQPEIDRVLGDLDFAKRYAERQYGKLLEAIDTEHTATGKARDTAVARCTTAEDAGVLLFGYATHAAVFAAIGRSREAFERLRGETAAELDAVLQELGEERKQFDEVEAVRRITEGTAERLRVFVERHRALLEFRQNQTVDARARSTERIVVVSLLTCGADRRAHGHTVKRIAVAMTDADPSLAVVEVIAAADRPSPLLETRQRRSFGRDVPERWLTPFGARVGRRWLEEVQAAHGRTIAAAVAALHPAVEEAEEVVPLDPTLAAAAQLTKVPRMLLLALCERDLHVGRSEPELIDIAWFAGCIGKDERERAEHALARLAELQLVERREDLRAVKGGGTVSIPGCHPTALGRTVVHALHAEHLTARAAAQIAYWRALGKKGLEEEARKRQENQDTGGAST